MRAKASKQGRNRILVRLGQLLCVVAIGVGLQVTWHNTLKDRFVPKRFVAVDEDLLYRSGQLSRYLVGDILVDHRIGLVIDLNGYEEKWLQDQVEEERVARELGVEHLRFPLRGNGTGSTEAYAQAIAAIDSAQRLERPVLVHCAAGARRTGGVIAAYQVLVGGVEPESAFLELSRFGSDVAESKLVPFLNEIMEPLAIRLVELGVIDSPPDRIPRFTP